MLVLPSVTVAEASSEPYPVSFTLNGITADSTEYPLINVPLVSNAIVVAFVSLRVAVPITGLYTDVSTCKTNVVVFIPKLVKPE